MPPVAMWASTSYLPTRPVRRGPAIGVSLDMTFSFRGRGRAAALSPPDEGSRGRPVKMSQGHAALTVEDADALSILTAGPPGSQPRPAVAVTRPPFARGPHPARPARPARPPGRRASPDSLFSR